MHGATIKINIVMSDSRFSLLIIHYQGDKAKEKDMCDTCSTYGGIGQKNMEFWWGN